MFVEEGEDLRVWVYGEHVHGNVRFEGGSAGMCTYLNEVERGWPMDYELGEEAFVAELEGELARRLERLDSMGFDSTFTRLETCRLRWSAWGELETYPLYHAWSTGDRDYVPSTGYLEYARGLMVEDEGLMGLWEYREGMASLVSLMSTSGLREYDAYKYLLAQTRYVEEHVRGEALRELLVTRFAYDYIFGVGIDEHAGEVVAIFNRHVRDSVLQRYFWDCYERSMRIAPGQPARDFTFTDRAGRGYRLADFRGKYLFLNVWASWGMPCRVENRAWRELEAAFEGRGVVFATVSCDRDRGAWERAIAREASGRLELYMGWDEEFMDFYKLRGIPRFILIDGEGRIVNSDMPRPSLASCREMLEALPGLTR